MQKWINRNFFTLAFAAAAGYTMLLLLTFDAFCLETVTPEQPLITIAGLKFFRNEFTILIFALAAVIGAAAARLLNRKAAVLIPLMAASLFAFMGFIALFDVDLMQSLDPTMRISHVTMSVSRVLSIVAGVSGIPTGYLLAASLERAEPCRLIPAFGAAALAALAALSDQLYVPVYLAFAVLAVAAGIALGYADPAVARDFTFRKRTDAAPAGVCRMLCAVLGGFLLALSALCLPNYYMQQLGGGEVAILAAVACGFLLSLYLSRRGNASIACLPAASVLALMAVFWAEKALVLPAAVLIVAAALVSVWKSGGAAALSALGGVLGAVCAYCLRHFAGQEIVYSNNRTLYITQPNVFIAILAVCLLLLALAAAHMIAKKKLNDEGEKS